MHMYICIVLCLSFFSFRLPQHTRINIVGKCVLLRIYFSHQGEYLALQPEFIRGKSLSRRKGVSLSHQQSTVNISLGTLDFAPSQLPIHSHSTGNPKPRWLIYLILQTDYVSSQAKLEVSPPTSFYICVHIHTYIRGGIVPSKLKGRFKYGQQVLWFVDIKSRRFVFTGSRRKDANKVIDGLFQLK